MRSKNLRNFSHSSVNKKAELVVATKNHDKIFEIKKLLSGLPVKIIPYKGITPRETGKTLEENAVIKAMAAARCSGIWAISDDTGLEVEALGGKPGVFSARFAGKGPDVTYEKNVRKLLKVMKGVLRHRRKACFKTAVCLASPDGLTKYIVTGKCCGRITDFPAGNNGFGYDPVFYYPPYRKTFAQMSPDEKNRVSHRARAFKKAKKLITRILLDGRKGG